MCGVPTTSVASGLAYALRHLPSVCASWRAAAQARVVPDTSTRGFLLMRRPGAPGSAPRSGSRDSKLGTPYPPGVHADVGRGDDLRQHGENILKNLATVTLVLITVMAFLDRNTNYNSPRDYLIMISIQVVLFILFECVGHLRHRKQLLSRRAVT